MQLGWQRDTLGRPTQQRITAGRGRAIRQRDFVWSSSDQPVLIDDSQTGTSQYEYDGLGSLRGAVYSDGTQELRLPDAVGNLFESIGRGDRQYGAGGQLLNSVHGSYDYDAEGNLTRKTTPRGDVWHYEWLGNGMLSRVTRPDGQPVTFGYDALGRRVSKSYKGKVTRWVWEGNKPLHEWSELTLDGRNTDDVITWLFEEDSFAPLARLQGTSRQSILTDHLGTPLEMVNQNGQVSWSAQTTSYGRVRMEEGTRNACPFRFQGQYEDTETGLYYNRFRYYAPEEGVYISQDPIGLVGGMETYNYVPNPATWVDPNELSGVPDFATLKHMAQHTLDFSTVKDGSVFWSGPRTKDVQKWAAANGKTTLEQTIGGKYLNDLKLFETIPGIEAAAICEIASKRFADGASGVVNVFSTGAKMFGPFGERTWWRIEKPALLKNDTVSGIIRRSMDSLKTKVGHITCK